MNSSRLALVAVALFVEIAIGCEGRSVDVGPPLVDVASLERTDVLPCAEVRLAPERNLVYCATFQVAWDEMKGLLGGPIVFDEDVPLATLLNRSPFEKGTLSSDSYLARGGRIEAGVVNTIRREMHDRFPRARMTLSVDPNWRSGLVAYAYLAKVLSFTAAFDRNPAPLVFHSPSGDVRIKSFGLRPGSKHPPHHLRILSEQVAILSYNGPNDFIVSLRSDTHDELVLAKVSPQKTLAATIAAVNHRVAGTVESPGHWNYSQEPIAVPLLDVNLHRRYSEFENKLLKNLNFQIVVAAQDIRFQLDERGARLESQAEVTGKTTVTTELTEVRFFIFDRPFLLMMREGDAAQPYFAIWIANSEVLVPF